MSDNWSIAGEVWSRWGEYEKLYTVPGTGILVNTDSAGSGDNLFTDWEHGDLELELDYLIPRGSNSGIYLQGRYEVQLFDSWGQEHPTFADAGGIYQRWDERRGNGREGFEGHAPLQNTIRAPGLWNHLRIVFQAPRFDAQGRKTQEAKFVVVEHNGVVVQENVEVTGPTRAAAYEDEQPMGPLMIQGDHGPVAFKNIRYRSYGDDRITLSDLSYRIYDGVFSSPADYAGLTPDRTGTAEGLIWQIPGERADTFAITFGGTMHVPVSGDYRFGLGLDWIDDDPHFSGRVRGGGELVIDGRRALVHPGTEEYVTDLTRLEEGTYPFTLTYFKNRGWWSPIVEFYVEGSDVPYHVLNAPGTLPVPPPIDRIHVAPAGEPIVQRSFVWHEGEKRVKAVNVGDPSGIHYAYDLDEGALLYLWKGDFIETTPMWHSRGNDQVALPLGSVLGWSGTPPLAALPNPNAAWPDTVDASADFRFESYTLDASGLPTFHYTLHGVNVDDEIAPAVNMGGGVLTRRMNLSNGGSRTDLWMRIAEGESIVQREDGLYNVDDRFYVDVSDAGGQRVTIRTQGGRQELVVPVRFSGGAADVGYSIIW